MSTPWAPLKNLAFAVNLVGLREAFATARLVSDAEWVLLKVARAHLAFLVERGDLRCEVGVRLHLPCTLQEGQAVVLRARAPLFTDLLCSPVLWRYLGQSPADAPDARLEFAPAPETARSEADKIMLRISCFDFRTDRLFEIVDDFDIRMPEDAVAGAPVRAISDVIKLVRPFADRGSDARFRTVEVDSTRALAASVAGARLVQGAVLPNTDIRVDRVDAGAFATLLLRTNPADIRTWIAEPEGEAAQHGFADGAIRCVIRRSASPLPKLDHVFAEAPLFAVTIATHELLNGIDRIKAQMRRDTPVIRMVLETEPLALRFETRVRGGWARVSCELKGLGGEAAEPTPFELLINGSMLAEAGVGVRSERMELQIFSYAIMLVGEGKDGVRVKTLMHPVNSPGYKPGEPPPGPKGRRDKDTPTWTPDGKVTFSSEPNSRLPEPELTREKT